MEKGEKEMLEMARAFLGSKNLIKLIKKELRKKKRQIEKLPLTTAKPPKEIRLKI